MAQMKKTRKNPDFAQCLNSAAKPQGSRSQTHMQPIEPPFHTLNPQVLKKTGHFTTKWHVRATLQNRGNFSSLEKNILG